MKYRYVLITPVKDEESVIAKAISSVVSQNCLPLQWVIVDDGSQDATVQIVKDAADVHSWIRLVRLPRRPQRSFAAVVEATEKGVRSLTLTDYDYIGLLDADVSFSADYFEKVLERFEGNQQLGLAGGHVVDPGMSAAKPPLNLQDVPGAAQMFRRKCFKDIGGLYAIPEGGWDALTCGRARMMGWETKLFPDLILAHLKPRNIVSGRTLRRMEQLGARDFALGYHPLFEIFKCISRVTERPPLMGAILRLFGYFRAMAENKKFKLPMDLVQFLHKEQLLRIKAALRLVN